MGVLIFSWLCFFSTLYLRHPKTLNTTLLVSTCALDSMFGSVAFFFVMRRRC